MKTYKVIAIDPSYRRTGVFTDNSVGTPFLFREGYYSSIVRGSLGPLEFGNLAKIAIDIREEFVERYCQVRYKNAIMEYPPPRGSMSPALFALDILLYEQLILVSDTLYLVPCNAIKSFVSQISKTDVVNFIKGDHSLKRFNHDEASAVTLYEIVLSKLKGDYRGTVFRVRGGKSDRL